MYHEKSYKLLFYDDLEEYQEVQLKIESQLKEMPDNIHLLNNLGILHYELGNLDLAEEFLSLSSNLGNISSLESLCDVYAKTNRLGKAIETIESLIKKESDNTKIGGYHRTIAMYHENADDAKKAIESYENSLKADPVFDKALLFIAEILERSGNKKEGKEYRVKYGSGKKL